MLLFHRNKFFIFAIKIVECSWDSCRKQISISVNIWILDMKIISSPHIYFSMTLNCHSFAIFLCSGLTSCAHARLIFTGVSLPWAKSVLSFEEILEGLGFRFRSYVYSFRTHSYYKNLHFQLPFDEGQALFFFIPAVITCYIYTPVCTCHC